MVLRVGIGGFAITVILYGGLKIFGVNVHSHTAHSKEASNV